MKQYLLVFACLLTAISLQAKTSPEKVFSSSSEDAVPGISTMLQWVEFETAETVEIDRRDLQEVLVSVFPNPFTDKMTITAKAPIESYKIYNILGSLVAENRSNTNIARIDTSKFHSGVYLLEVYSGNTKTTLKVIKK